MYESGAKMLPQYIKALPGNLFAAKDTGSIRNPIVSSDPNDQAQSGSHRPNEVPIRKGAPGGH